MEQNYFVYKLFNPDYPEFYVGSTKDMKARKRNHKTDCNNPNGPRYNFKVYEYIRSNGGYDSWNYEILEHIRNSINVVELRNVERKYIEELKPSLNIDIPNRTKKEWRQDNKEQILEYNKQYRQNNKEQIKENYKQYYENNREHFKQYYENNRESIAEKRNQKFNCIVCGGKYTKKHKTTHFKSRKHQNFIN